MADKSYPPIPLKLREMLKDYPRHLQSIEEDLARVAGKKSPTPAFERAIWVIEDALGAFVVEARDELKAAEANGDPEAIARAAEKESLMSRASWKHVWLSDDALWNYFQRD